MNNLVSVEQDPYECYFEFCSRFVASRVYSSSMYCCMTCEQADSLIQTLRYQVQQLQMSRSAS